MVAFSVSGLSDRSVPAGFRERLGLGPDRHMVEQQDSRVPVFAPARSASRPGGRTMAAPRRGQFPEQER